jgi:hypothetical protein
LLQSSVAHGDGTFSVLPTESFYQLYSLHGELAPGVTAPLVFLLLPNKTSVTYKKAFELVKTALPGVDWNTEYFNIDFEQAVIKALKEVLPNCRIALCFFHLGQSIWRFIGEKGLRVLYQAEEGARLLIGKLKVFIKNIFLSNFHVKLSNILLLTVTTR